jgi:hypothetical protein
MENNIIKFPGFLLMNDRNTILKDGKRYKNTKAMVADLPYRDLNRTYQWQCKRSPCQLPSVLDTRARTMRRRLDDQLFGGEEGNAA